VSESIPAPPGGCKVIPGWPSYAVGPEGIVHHYRSGNWKPINTSNSGNVRLFDGERYKRVSAGECVLRAFVGPRPLGCVPLHWPDNSPANNALENLRWAPRGTDRLGVSYLSRRGPQPHRRKLDAAQVAEAKELLYAGFAFIEVAERFGVSLQTVRRACGDDRPQRKGAPPGFGHWDAKLSPARIRRIVKWYSEGASANKIARRLGVSQPTILNLVKGKSYGGIGKASPPRTFRIDQATKNEIMAKRKDGWSIRKLAQEFRVCWRTVERIVRPDSPIDTLSSQ
jgi:transposase